MGVTADLKLYKALLILIDFVFLLASLALIGLGSWALADYVEGISGQNLAIGMIILGCVAFIIAFVGCLGAIKESRNALRCYAVMVLILMFIQLALGITAYVLRDDIPAYAESSWNNLDVSGKEELEKLFHCCGWSGPYDNSSGLGDCAAPEAGTPGCQDAIVNAIEDSFLAIGITAIVIACVELLVVLFSCCLVARIPTEKDREQALLEEARKLNRDTDPVAANYSSTAAYQTYK